MANTSYWEKRQEQKFLAGEKKVKDYYKNLEKSFEQAKKEIQMVINDFVTRYAIENDTPGGFAKAQRLLNRTELGDLDDFIDKVKANMGKYNQELNNMSYKVRITRYQALEKQIDAILQQLYAVDYQYQGEEVLKEVYSDAYYQTWFNIDQYKGFHQEFAQINAQVVDELIRYPFNGADYSTRLWKQKDHMLQQLNESITTMLIQGRNPMTLSKDFSKKFETKEFEAYRLLHTEGSFMIEQGTLAAYKEDGVEKYQILATLDTKTSDICRDADGDVYDVDKAVTGKNYPPLHVFCRSTTVPHYEDADTWLDERVARDPDTGKTYKVWADTKYPEWYEKYVRSKEDIPKYEAKVQEWIDEYKGIAKSPKPVILKSDKQFGKKIGKHTKEYGLDPGKPGDRIKMESIIDNILSNRDEVVSGNWRGQEGLVDFYIKDSDVVVVNKENFVTILKGGVENARVKNARKRKI